MIIISYLLILTTLVSNRKNLIIHKIELPGLLEVFPELNNLWPIWVKKNNVKLKCKVDDDCLFPQACCHHPIIPGDKFCCNGGYKKRILKYAFIGQEIKSNNK